MNSSAIVIAAYNRPYSLSRLLQSLTKAHYTIDNIPLIISIDKSDVAEVSELADSFDWKHGEKKIIKHSKRLGLKEHILRCGDLTVQYGNIILLEDDLIVSPYFYKFSADALAYYSGADNVAGISLYSYQIAENGFFPFYPHNDGSDVYFIQLPSSWGEIFTTSSWSSFRKWNEERQSDFPENILPDYVKAWQEHSWKKRFTAYLISKDKYFVYPRTSYSTNYGDPGTNTDRKGLFQVPLMYAVENVVFKDLEQSLSVYDSYFEMIPTVLKKLDTRFGAFDFTVDTHATKRLEQISTDYILSSRKCRQPVLSFGNDLPDPIQNVLSNSRGEFYSLGKKQDFESPSPHFFDFYTHLTSISDIVMSKHVSHFEFTQKYPKLFIGVKHEGSHQQLEETLQSISIQLYPKSQVQVVVFNSTEEELRIDEKHGKFECVTSGSKENFIKDFCNAVESSDAQYFVTMRSGDVFYDYAFEAVNTIFKRYPDVNWLTGVETIRSENGFNIFHGNTATRRWNARIYERNLYENSLRYIPPAATFWKRYLWDAAREGLNFVSRHNFYEDIWLAFFKSQKLFTCDVYFSSSPVHNTPKLRCPRNLMEYSLIEDKFVNRLQEFFFINNIPYLRVYYKVKNNLAEVIRLDHEGQWYFQSDF